MTSVRGNAKPTWTGAWHVNVGVKVRDARVRNWDDSREYGFLSAGQGEQFRSAQVMSSKAG